MKLTLLALFVFTLVICTASSERIAIKGLSQNVQRKLDMLHERMDQEEAKKRLNANTEEEVKLIDFDLIPNAYKYVLAKYGNNEKIINKIFKDRGDLENK